MACYILENDELRLEIDSFGAELRSVRKKETEVEYLWDARPEFWKRSSPILFPLVGSLRGGAYIYNGIRYEMSQHGFARDMEFELVSQTKESIEFVLRDTEGTLAIYPFHFELQIGYCLKEQRIEVSWKVKNTGNGEMYFAIGGHPAFMCPVVPETRQTDFFLKIGDGERVVSSVLGNKGLLTDRKRSYSLENGYLKVSADLFGDDALIIEDNQAKEVSLCGEDRQPYLTVRFDAPLFGIWSPPGKNAPFICIEPWYGRCDREDFSGTMEEREWENKLISGDVFECAYEIEIC